MRGPKIITIFLLIALTGAAVIAAAWRTSEETPPAAASVIPPNEPDDKTRAARVPVLVELFTSEGCSSCPPADVVLQQLEQTQPVAGVEIIPLSLHVDYWNDLGWADPYSAAAYSERQNEYAATVGRKQIYTPQMVVDGQTEFVGSQAGQARQAIKDAAQQPKAVIQLRKQDGATDKAVTLSVNIEKLPPVSRGDEAEVWLAVTESGLLSQVARGENAGRRLGHTAVTRQLTNLGPADKFTNTPQIKLNSAWQRDNLRAVIFIQEKSSRHITGAATLSLKNSGQ